MSDPTYPVLIQTKSGPVRVGTLTRAEAGIFLSLGEMFLGEAVPAARSAAPAPAARSSGPVPTTFPNYGRNKNGPIAGASDEDLQYYAAGARRSIADPSKSRWHDNERALLAAIEGEMARQPGGQAQGAPRPAFMDAPGGAQSSFRDEPPGPSDSDIPF